MSTSDEDLAAFWAARLDEDEATAERAAGAGGRYGGRPHWSALGRGIVTDAEDPDWGVVDLGPCIEDGDLAAHIARHDPARVLREVQADRCILASYADFRREAEAQRASRGDVGSGVWTGYRKLCDVIRLRAAVWNGHPDYREEWKP